jgi:hypothetical protein
VFFVDFADDIARRAAASAPMRLLELAAGTGIVTRRLREAGDAHPVWLKNRTRSAGCVSKIWSPSGIAIQGCLLRVQKCTVGRSQEVSSKVPPRTLRTVAPGREAQTHEPHSGQIHQIVSLPLSARRWTAFGSPRTTRKAPSGSTQAIEKALLVIRWQSAQWQV